MNLAMYFPAALLSVRPLLGEEKRNSLFILSTTPESDSVSMTQVNRSTYLSIGFRMTSFVWNAVVRIKLIVSKTTYLRNVKLIEIRDGAMSKRKHYTAAVW